MTEKLYIIGLGATAEEIRLFVEKYNLYTIGGFIVNKQYIKGNEYKGYPVFALEDLHTVINKDKDKVFVALFWNHLNEDRRKLYNQIKEEGYKFATLISPKCEYNSSKIGENCWLADNVYVKPNVIIGDNTFINAGAIVEINTVIGKHIFIATGAVVGGSCELEDQCFVGLNATVFDHTSIGHHSIIGAATAVKRNLKPYSIIKKSNDSDILVEYNDKSIIEKLVVQKNVR